MFTNLLKFELELHTKQVGFWITAAIMVLLGVFATSTEFGSAFTVGEKVKANGSLTLTNLIGGLSTAVIFFGTVFTVTGAMRDDEHHATEVIHATPVTTRAMIWSRFAGIFLVVFGCIFALTLGAFAGQFMPYTDKETLGPINVLYFLYPLVLFALPSCLFVCTIYILLAGLTRNKNLVYVSALGVLIVSTLVGFLNEVDNLKPIAAFLDPFGSVALANETEFWPADERNNRLVPLTREILINRIFWLAVTLAGLWYAQKLFMRGITTRKVGKKSKSDADDGVLGAITAPVAVATVAPHKGKFARFWTRFKYEYLTTVKSIPFAILLLIAVMQFIFVLFLRSELNEQPILLTGTNAFDLAQTGFILFLLLMMVFFGGDIIWRDRTAKISELLDSTPVPNWILLASKWAAVLAMVYTVILIACIAALAGQAFMGVGPLRPFEMFARGFLEIGVVMTFWVILIMFVQNFAPNRIFGIILGGGLLFAILFFIGQLPFQHPLMRYGSLALGNYSDMNGYTSTGLINAKHFGLYWAGLAGIFGVLSVWLWRRGTDVRLATRIKSLSGQMGRGSIALGVLSVLAFFGMGGFIFYKANVENTFYTDKRAEKRLVEIEKNFKELWQKPLPKLQSVEVDVQLFPSKQQAELKGRYVIKNVLDEPVSELYIAMPTRYEEDVRQLDLDGATRVTDSTLVELADTLEMGQRLYRFDPPLAVGATTTLDFDIFFHEPRFYDSGPIRKKANFLNNSRMPQLGINYSFLRNPDKRRKYDLPEKDKRPDRDDMDARQNNFFTKSADYVDFKANICTDAGQIPIAPGKFKRETTPADDRVCREYEATNPIMNFFSFVSAPYEVLRDTWDNPKGDDVDLAIYYHKDHAFNVEAMRDAMQSSLTTFTETYGPYQYAQARIMEVPYVNFAQAFAGTIPFSENIGFVLDASGGDDKIDFMTYVTVHELGHQWFGHQIVPADVKGYNVLSEGLTENASMTAYEVIKGYPMTRRIRKTRGDEYLSGRTSDPNPEPPLALAEDQQYIFYNKANIVFWGLKHYMEPGTMNAAIKGFIDAFGSTGSPYPTTKELVDYLRAAAPADLQQFITDSWEKITFWETGFGDVDVKENADGTFTVTATAKMAKKYADEKDGKETDAEVLNEPVEIGFYKEDPSNEWEEIPMLLERVRLTEAETELSFTLSERPGYIVIDPRALLMERKYNDNVKALDGTTSSSD
ncbi:hypothetical protein [Fretibacter rubidus]|uniref:ABC transporter permease/M1 family aminopeptidase n=1 Tax=Fretibacter rubidus TaxID=570162 RepID=UPI00352B18D9